MSEWISTENKLPQKESFSIAHIKEYKYDDLTYVVAFYDGEYFNIYNHSTCSYDIEVNKCIYWMPLPQHHKAKDE